MSTTTLRPGLIIGALALLALGCRDDVTTGPERHLRAGSPDASVIVESSSIYLLSVEVQGEGVDPGFFYDIPMIGGKSKLNLTLPAGSDRQIRLRGYDQYGQLTHQALASFPKIGEGLNDALKVTLDPVREGKPVTAAFSVVGEVPAKGIKMYFKQPSAVYEGSQGRIVPILVDELGEHVLDPRNVQWGVGEPIGGRIDPGTPYAYYTAAKAVSEKFLQKFSVCTLGHCFFGQIQNLPDPFVDVRAGDRHTCAIRSSGKVSCWGANGSGRLGSEAMQPNRPSPVTGTWKQIAVGLNHACAISLTSAAFCWGYDGSNQLGIGPQSTSFSTTPTAVVGGIAFSQITAAFEHTCGISTAGIGFCWGGNDWTQLGIGSSPWVSLSPVDHPVQIQYTLHWTQLSARSMATCGVDEQGNTMCWGGAGSVGYPTSSDVGIPGNVGAVAGTATQLSIGPGAQTCLIEAIAGVTDCWGPNGGGQVGVGYVSGSPAWSVISPTPVAGTPQTFAMVSTSERTTCAVNTSHVVYCWGDNSLNQLGTGGATNVWQPTPAPVVTSLQFSRVAAGSWHTCALTLDGDIWCWGDNSSGQLGNATYTSSSTPVKVAP